MATELAVTDDNGYVDDRIEKIIWKNLGRKSARQIADEAGVSPEVVLRVKRELLESVDVLTIQEKRQKLLVDLQDMAQRAQDDYDRAPMEFKSGLLNSATASIKAVLVELNRADKADQSKVDALNQMRINELLRLIDVTVARTLEEISKTYGLDQSELLGIFQGHLKPVAQELEEQ